MCKTSGKKLRGFFSLLLRPRWHEWYRKLFFCIILLQMRVRTQSTNTNFSFLFSLMYLFAWKMQNLNEIDKTFDLGSSTLFRLFFRPHDAKNNYYASFCLLCSSGQTIVSTTKSYAQQMYVFLCVYMSIWNNDYVHLDVFLASNVSVFTQLKVDVLLDFKNSSFIILCILNGRRTQ